MGVSRPCGPLCRAPLGGLPGGRGSKASSRLFSVCGARHSRWQDGASSARVSRSRAMPVGDRRSSRPGACSRSVVRGTHGGGRERHRRGFRAPARCRSETGAPAWRSCWQERASLVLVSRFRAMPVGDRRSSRPRACSPSVVRGTHAGGMERHRRGFRASARCRSETGAPAWRSCWQERASLVLVSRFRAMPVGDRRSSRARACSRSVVRGTHAGRMERHRRGFRASARCRSEDRRSRPSRRLFSVCGARHSGWQDGASSARVSRSRAMPVGDRRSSRARACSRSVVRGTHGGGRERHRRGFRAPARCRSETGAPVVLALVLRLRCAALRLAGWSVIGAGFALPRDAGRRPALLAVPALVLGLWCAALTLVGWSVIGAGFALPRDAGRRPALLAVPALVLGLWCAALTVAGWSVIGTGFALPRDAGLKTGAPGGARHSRWREGTSSEQVSRSRAMPV